MLEDYNIFLYQGEGSGEGSRENIPRDSTMGGFGNLAPFSDTCANYWYIRWSSWRSFGVSFGAVSWRCLGGRFRGVLEIDLASLGNQFEGLVGVS